MAFAQTTGTVEGAVTDQSNSPLPGVTVELTGAKLQGARSTVTAADGRYRFLNLIPGDYAITATLAGFGKVEKRATVTLDATATANLQLNLSTTAEVTVTGEAPLIDSTSTTTGSNYANKVIDKLPLASRNYAAIVLSQPGVQFDNGESQGRSPSGNGGGAMMAAGGGGGISVYGSTSSENSFLIDGVNTTNVIKGIQGKDINNEFVQEVEVKTGGYQAEYGRNTGGIDQRHHEVGRQRVPRRHLRLLQQPGTGLRPEEPRDPGLQPDRQRAGHDDPQQEHPLGRRPGPRRIRLEGPRVVLRRV